MLGKVMKYEFRSSARLLLPFFGLALVFSGFLRLLLFLAPRIWPPAAEVLSGLAGTLGVLLLIAVVLVAFCAVIARFYQSMVSNEAYLSFTLPVKIDTHLLGRTIVATVYSFAAVLVAAACGLIFIPGFGNLALTILSQESLSGTPFTLGNWFSVIGMVVVFVLVALLSNLLKIYASLAIGTQFGQNRILGGIGAYLLLNVIEGILLLPLVLIPLAFTLGSSNDALTAYVQSLVVSSDISATIANLFGFAWVVIAIVSALTLALSVVHYFLTRYFFSKKLNLE